MRLRRSIARRLWLLSLLSCAAFVCLVAGCSAPVSKIALEPVDVSHDPAQTAIDRAVSVHLQKDGVDWTLTPKAGYVVSGIVLGCKRYRYGWNADLAPCDVALAWGDFATSKLYKKLSWSQSDRWYWWRFGPGFGHGNGYIVAHSSNNHVIPATRNLFKAAVRIDKGDRVRLEGYLVFVDGVKGGRTFRWHSSLSRRDEGNGSCEIIYLKKLTVGEKTFE